MKSKTFVIIFSLLILFLYNSCKKDEADNPGGVTGFEGTYQVRENCNNNGYSGYSMNIKGLPNTNQVNLYNFFNLGTNKYIFGEVNGLQLNIPLQTYSGFNVSGLGSISGSSLVINFSVDDNVLVDSCSANCIKQ
jgi:hypothetical protein